MRVTISDIEFDVDNTPAGVDQMLSRIDTTMQDFQVYFSHLVVDGVNISDSSREHLISQLPDIQNVNVVFLTADQYLYKVLDLMGTFLEKAMPAMQDVAHEFYGHHDGSTWERFNQLMTLLNQVVQIIHGLVANPDFRGKVGQFNELGLNIVDELVKLNDAIVSNDMILAADLLLYELQPFTENLYAALQELSRSERHEIH
jgi:hypothetical protein